PHSAGAAGPAERQPRPVGQRTGPAASDVAAGRNEAPRRADGSRTGHTRKKRPRRELPAPSVADGRSDELARPLPAFLDAEPRSSSRFCGEGPMPASPSVAATVKPSLTIKRRLHAPPAKVYAAWTEPAQLVRWFGPEGIIRVEAKTDVR